MSRRFYDAYMIQQGACNPAGIARSLVEACDEYWKDNPEGSTTAQCQDPAIRLIVHQLAHLCGAFELNNDMDAWSKAYTLCEKEAEQIRLIQS